MDGNYRPPWRLPVDGRVGVPHELSAAFIAKRFNIKDAKKCESTNHGKPCTRAALRGAKYCKFHGGLLGAAKAEAERLGRPVIIVRRPRAKAVATRGIIEAWPDGLPKHDRFMSLGPFQRGRLFEAWENRLTAPDMWANELAMPRYRHERGDR